MSCLYCLFNLNCPSEWTLGGLGHYGGWHCSWCYEPQGIRQKLVSAQRHDKPRWGDYPEKLDLDYIARLVEEGEWFDGKRPFIRFSFVKLLP